MPRDYNLSPIRAADPVSRVSIDAMTKDEGTSTPSPHPGEWLPSGVAAVGHPLPVGFRSHRVIVTTESGSCHLGDFDAGFYRRFRSPHDAMAADLRKDGEAIPLLGATTPTVGQPWTVWVTGLKPDADFTNRTTTPVTEVDWMDDSSTMPLRHICEVCGAEQPMTPDEAFEAGWDYPPRMGVFGVLSPRTCPNCTIDKTLWWAITVDHVDPTALTNGLSPVVWWGLGLAGGP